MGIRRGWGGGNRGLPPCPLGRGRWLVLLGRAGWLGLTGVAVKGDRPLERALVRVL